MKAMKLILALAALSVAHLASAEMLYWMIGDKTNGGANTIAFNYAAVYASNGDETVALPKDVDGGEIYGNEDLTSITTTNPQMTELGEGFAWKDYSFYVELLAWDGVNETTVGHSETLSYAQLVSQGHIVPSGMGIPPTAHIWMPTTAAPEPSSALLLLVGGALLFLKRRIA